MMVIPGSISGAAVPGAAFLLAKAHVDIRFYSCR
jgi:hypothetical protein